MPGPDADISTLSTALRELTARITGLADDAVVARDEELATELFAVERALTGASRRLARLSAALSRR